MSRTPMTDKAKMYMRGRRESMKLRTCEGWECACTLTYWDRKLGKHPLYKSFLDGWSNAANGIWEYAEENDVKVPAGERVV